MTEDEATLLEPGDLVTWHGMEGKVTQGVHGLQGYKRVEIAWRWPGSDDYDRSPSSHPIRRLASQGVVRKQ